MRFWFYQRTTDGFQFLQRELNLFTPALLISSLFVPIYLGKYISGDKPLCLMPIGYVYSYDCAKLWLVEFTYFCSIVTRMLLGVAYMFVLWYAKAVYSSEADVRPWYMSSTTLLVLVLVLYLSHEVATNLFVVSEVWRFARSS